MFRPGDRIDRYVIERVLGKGGMSVVYLARHDRLRSAHAIKILQINVPSVKRRLLIEGRVQASLKHPNVVAVTDVLEFGDHLALVMEYVSGPPLNRLLADPMSVDEALRIFRGLVTGIAAAHDAGLVHRDLKPANVLLARSNVGLVPKVTDFGLVKVIKQSDTKSGVALGTPNYMSPEQIKDASSVDHRADLWALGVILYEMLAGRPPFRGENPLVTFNNIANRRMKDIRALRPEVPRRVADVIDALLQVDPDARLRSTEEILTVLYQDSALHDVSEGRALHETIFTPTAPPGRRVDVDIEEVGVIDPTRIAVDGVDTWEPASDLEPVRAPPEPPRQRRGGTVVVLALMVALSVLVVVGFLFGMAMVALRGASEPGPVDVVVTGVPAGVPVVLSVADDRIVLEGTMSARLALDRAGEHAVAWAVGPGCDVPGCPSACPSWCAVGSDTIAARRGAASVATLSLAPPAPRDVAVEVGQPVTSAALDGVPMGIDGARAVMRGVAPGPHTVEVIVGECPEEAAGCADGGGCPPGCAAASRDIVVPVGDGALVVPIDVPVPVAPAPAPTPRAPARSRPGSARGPVSTAAYAAWLDEHPEWGREAAVAAGRVDDRYLRAWASGRPAGAVTQVPWDAAAAYCADRGGLAGLADPPLTWDEGDGPTQEWRDAGGRPAWRRFDGETSTSAPRNRAFSFTGFRCRR